jgi:hypothetical protein
MQRTTPRRILTEGAMSKLIDRVKKQFKQKHRMDLDDDQAFEAIAGAVEDAGLFGKEKD